MEVGCSPGSAQVPPAFTARGGLAQTPPPLCRVVWVVDRRAALRHPKWPPCVTRSGRPAAPSAPGVALGLGGRGQLTAVLTSREGLCKPTSRGRWLPCASVTAQRRRGRPGFHGKRSRSRRTEPRGRSAGRLSRVCAALSVASPAATRPPDGLLLSPQVLRLLRQWGLLQQLQLQ